MLSFSSSIVNCQKVVKTVEIVKIVIIVKVVKVVLRDASLYPRGTISVDEAVIVVFSFAAVVEIIVVEDGNVVVAVFLVAVVVVAVIVVAVVAVVVVDSLVSWVPIVEP